MRHLKRLLALAVLAAGLVLLPKAPAQVRPYIGFVYPAGGQQGTTVQLKLGGQGLDGVQEVIVSGAGVQERSIEYNRALGPQEITLLNEQLKELRKGPGPPSTNAASVASQNVSTNAALTGERSSDKTTVTWIEDAAATNLIGKIERRIKEYVNRPASVALAHIIYAQVAVAPDAQPGERELRVRTLRGISNPLVFHVGQVPEVCRKPMLTASYQLLGKEELALRKRPPDEVEERITIPCTVNGQIASGEFNRYRFATRKGQRLVFNTQARQLIPYIADAVPGWFQPVLALYDANGKEVAYDDDYRFRPDPVILYQVPKDGEYTFVIYDAIYRGREDFVYRVTVGETPFITSIFPPGARTGAPPQLQTKGWNLGKATVAPPAKDAAPGIYSLVLSNEDFVSNRLPFALDSVPEFLEKEPNDALESAPKVNLPLIVNGRMDRRDDWDIFQFQGSAGQTIVAEVYARRLDSPLDSVLKLTDGTGRVLAFNDDHEDLGSGLNTHHADSYLTLKLPTNGTYYVHLGETAQNAGPEYAYRLRIGPTRPDFALRVVPSSLALRSKGTAAVSVYAIRKDGFTGPIRLGLKDPPPGFSANPVSISGTQTVARLTIKSDFVSSNKLVNLLVAGSAMIQGRQVTNTAVPAEDRMQAFLWRHLVPATELKALVYDPSYDPAPKRVPPVRPSPQVEVKPVAVAASSASTNKFKFTKQQVAGRLRQLKLLYEEGLLTDDFYELKVAECEAAQ